MRECPEVCNKVYGDGNPDISGIGVLISFGIQGILCLILGPLLSFLFALKSLDSSPETQLTSWRCHILFDKVQGIGSLTCFATLISSYMTLRWGCSAYELLMIKKLIEYETTLVSHAVFAHVVDTVFGRTVQRQEPPSQRLWKFLTLWLLAFGVSAFHLYLKLGHDPSHTMGDIAGALIELCPKYQGFPLVSHVSVPAQAVGLVLDIVAIAGFMSLLILRFISTRVGNTFRRRRVELLFAFYMPVRLAVYLTTTFWDVVQVRSRMREKSSASNTDNHWSFGQVGAVIIWTPAVFHILVFATSMYPFIDRLSTQNDATCKFLRRPGLPYGHS